MTHSDRPISLFSNRCLAEAVRLHERDAGPLDDRRVAAQLRNSGKSTEQRILERARVLGTDSGLLDALRRWLALLRWSLIVLAGLALITGFSAALAVLGDGERPVNVVWVLGALLGLNLVMLTVWAGSVLLSGREGGGALGRLWLGAVRLLAGSRQGLVARAMISRGTLSDVNRWALSAVTHGFWLLSLLAAMLALLLALSLRAYQFVWETTILSPTVFVGFVEWSSWLPARLGFTVPDESMVRLSEVVAPSGNEEALRRAWSSWLLGCLLVYGIGPRLLLLMLSLALLFYRLRGSQLDLSSPRWSALAARLNPGSEQGGVTDPDTLSVAKPRLMHDPDSDGLPLMVAVELGRGVEWPPAALQERQFAALGPADSREQRQQIGGQVRQTRPRRLLFVLDARLSPDRGMLHWLVELSAASAASRVWLLNAEDPAGAGRLQSWEESLVSVGFDPQSIHHDRDAALQWLQDATVGRQHG